MSGGLHQDDKDDVRIKGDDSGTDRLITAIVTAVVNRLATDTILSDGVDPTIKAEVDLLKQLHTTAQIRGASDDTPIGNIGDSLKVAGIFVFDEDFIKVAPGGGYESFVVLQHCTQKAILEQLRIMNNHLEVLTDIEDMENEPNNTVD